MPFFSGRGLRQSQPHRSSRFPQSQIERGYGVGHGGRKARFQWWTGLQLSHGSQDLVRILDLPASWCPNSSHTAAFGAELGNPLLGYVIPISSFTEPCAANESYHETPKELNWGCPSLCVTGPHQPEPAETWIALVQRGGCEFVHKVREAQRLGAKAVVVGGNDPDVSGYPDTLVNMYSQGGCIVLPLLSVC